MQNNDEIKPWKILSSKMALDVKWFPVRQDTVELPSGKVIDDYYLYESPEIAVVVPVTTDGKFVICQQYRHAVGQIMYQFPSGTVPKGETPLRSAERELLEETGYIAPHFEPLIKVAAYATKLTGWQNIFLAEGATQKQVPPYDPEEATRIVLV